MQIFMPYGMFLMQSINTHAWNGDTAWNASSIAIATMKNRLLLGTVL